MSFKDFTNKEFAASQKASGKNLPEAKADGASPHDRPAAKVEDESVAVPAKANS